MIQNCEKLAGTSTPELALSCIEAGIEAAYPVTILQNTFAYQDGISAIDSTDYDLEQCAKISAIGGKLERDILIRPARTQ